ncbi:hypothetical protein WA577_003576 [Blastocystis sp. JDR]
MEEQTEQPQMKLGLHSFAVGDVIGQGAFSKVMIARMKDTSKYFAIKAVNKSFIQKEGYVKEAMAERNALAVMNHPFIVRLVYSFQDSNNLYYVLELCRYGTLWDLEKSIQLPGKGCDPSLVRFYMAEIASAVDYLHNTVHLIHRDLKPENILISESGHLLLSDFGSVAKEGEVVSPADQPKVYGTLQYLAPEAVHGGIISPSVDMWAMGVMLYLLLTGCFLFDGEDELSVIHRIETFDADALEFPSYLSAVTQDLLRGLLQHDASKRLTSGQVLRHPYFEGIDFARLPFTTPPYTPPFSPLPVICDDELENELNALRGSIDVTYRQQQEERKEAISKLLQEEETTLYSSPVVHFTSSTSRKRILVLTSTRRLLILDSSVMTIKTVIRPYQIAKVDANHSGFSVSINHPSKRIFRFETPNKDQSVWCNCIQHVIREQRKLSKL